jgi:hypothetical protein
MRKDFIGKSALVPVFSASFDALLCRTMLVLSERDIVFLRIRHSCNTKNEQPIY